VLEASGFRVRRLAARVRYGTCGIRPRLHMLLLVEAEGEPWLADTGFGGDGLVQPIPFRTDREAPQFAWKYRLVAEPPNYVLQSWGPEGWIELYAFGLEEHYPIDFEVGNYYTSTHPESHFRKRLTAQFPGPERRVMLVNRTLSDHTAEGVVETPVGDDEALLGVLAARFGLVFPAGTRFPVDGEPRL
jgi:N-hydroxyarylamine O-acetyltransferase